MLLATQRGGFNVIDYDESKPLEIKPLVVYKHSKFGFIFGALSGGAATLVFVKTLFIYYILPRCH
jgi:hypothetical protein